MLKNRIIASVIVDNTKVVQTESFEFKHYIHYDALFAIKSFFDWSIDELVLINISRKEEKYHEFLDIIERTSEIARLPISVGGWINTIERGEEVIRLGAEKLIINSSFYENPEIPKTLSNEFGKQCIVASIDYKVNENGETEVYIDKGRKNIGESLYSWAEKCINNGAGELYVTNMEFEGKRNGYDISNLSKLVKKVKVPVIFFGGAMEWEHFGEGLKAGASAVAAANIFHYKELASIKLRNYLLANEFNVRKI